MADGWYEIVAPDARITQGDLIFDCPLIGWQAKAVALQDEGVGEVLRQATGAFRADTVVMTQACDLEFEKVSNVVLCAHLSLADFKLEWERTMRERDETPTARAWKAFCDDISDGYAWNLSFLNEARVGEFVVDLRVVDFHDIFTVPRIFLESLLRQRGQQRWRLLPPYREHLSQALARFFMRVGLPVPVTKNW